VTAQLVDGTAVARQVREDVAKGVAELAAVGGDAPGLATVLIGDDPASEVYVRNKRRACVAAGIRDLHRHLPSYVSQGDAAALLDELAASPDVSGILLQLPVPAHLDAEELLARIPAGKDVDGLTTANAGLLAQGRAGLRPCGVIALLDRYEVPMAGTHAVVVGRSALVGRPMAQLLIERNATVTMCHSRTRDLRKECRRADVLVVAAGVPGADRRERHQARCRRDGRRHPPRRARAARRRRFRVSRSDRRADHPGTRRRRPDDHRHAPGEHAHGRDGAGGRR